MHLFINLLYHTNLSFSSENVKIKNNKSEKINTAISMIQLIIENLKINLFRNYKIVILIRTRTT